MDRPGEQPQAMERWSPRAPLTVLPGIGPKLAARLEAADLRCVLDLLHLLPRRYREVQPVDAPGVEHLGILVRVSGRVRSARRRFLPGRRSLVSIVLHCPADAPVDPPTDPSGVPVELRFFNQPYLAHGVRDGEVRCAEGLLDRQGNKWVLAQPRLLPRDHRVDGAVQLVYPPVEGISQERLRTLILLCLERVDLARLPGAPLPPGLGAMVPKAVLRHSAAPSALRAIHAPTDVADHESARLYFAVREAVELFRRVQRARRLRQGRTGPRVDIDDALDQRIAARIPFSWTPDQAAAVEALRRALRGTAPMGILLQGDVGTGKTAVAMHAALGVIARGYQVAFLAPTELLAEQHMASVGPWLAGTDVRHGLLTASLGQSLRRELEVAAADGSLHLVFGTHALLSQRTRFARLGLCVIDEQQRFGVAQRMELLRKGRDPHVLVMTATPIPRTLALVMFGDLDAVVLRQRPPGRRSPRAMHLPVEAWPRLLRSVAVRVRRGRQTFVVCPMVGADGEKGGAVLVHRQLSQRFRAGLVHGRMGAAERQQVLAAFRAGELDVLVGTTVLEVGVDVPNATLIAVVACDRFGLATLHQLRGRVGRGSRQGLCVLIGAANSRTAALCRTTDGFELAEVDLELRGSGELMGRRQSGDGDLRALDVVADRGLLMQVRDAVRAEPSVGR